MSHGFCLAVKSTFKWHGGGRVNIDNMDGPIDLSACDPSNNVGKAAAEWESFSVAPIWNLCLTASSYPRDFSDSASLNLKSWMKCVEKVFRYYNHNFLKALVASDENVHSFWHHLSGSVVKSPIQGNLNYVVLDKIGHNWKCGSWTGSSSLHHFLLSIQLKLYQSRNNSIQFSIKADPKGENFTSSAWKCWMKTHQVLDSIFEFPQ